MSSRSRSSAFLPLLRLLLVAVLLIPLALAQDPPARGGGRATGAAAGDEGDEPAPAAVPGQTPPRPAAPAAPPAAPRPNAAESSPEDIEASNAADRPEDDEATESEPESEPEAGSEPEVGSEPEAEPEPEAEAPPAPEPEGEAAPIPENPADPAARPPPATITGNGLAGGNRPSNLPTLAGAFSYPPPSVPPTAGAPFMQHSTLPEGTIFIIVGATLGFFGFSILAWRGMVAWSVHRSVKRAAMEQTKADSKHTLRPRGNGFYAAGAGSTHSLDYLAGNPRVSTSRRKSHLSTSHLSTSNLFYSPTARTMSGTDNTMNRGSAYLPGGYYPVANAAAAGGAASVHLGTPTSHGHSRGRSCGTSPPSPSLSPGQGIESGYTRVSTSGVLPSQASTSSLNLSVPPLGRAPSAYLEDLFDSHLPQPTRPSHDRY